GGRLHGFGGSPAVGPDTRSDGGGGDAGIGDVVGEEAVADLLGRADLVLDGLLGIGGRGGLREPYATLAPLAPPDRTAGVDVPSGVDADTGAVTGPAIRASSTVTFGTYKPGLLLGPGAVHAGQVELVEIGLRLAAPTLEALDAADVAALVPGPG